MQSIKIFFFDFIGNKKAFPFFIVFAAGFYPFVHYYSSNLSIADSWQQLLFIGLICFGIPQLFLITSYFLFKIKFLKKLKPFSLSVINSISFTVLLGFLIFHFNRKQFLLAIIIAIVIGFVISKFIRKIVVLQILIALISLMSLLPQLWFAISNNTDNWSQITVQELNTTFVNTPNIFIIQPDGYVNFSEIYKAPYSFDNSEFEQWLQNNAFINYPNFRSNYYSTLTSNASLFAMKHHYYSNTNPNTLKTHNANKIIVGKDNNVLKILKRNNYKSHLITDNSYFLLNRIPLFYDFSNVKYSNIGYHNLGLVEGIDILKDFKSVLDTLQNKRNFFFIEKTIPSHIVYRPSLSKGIEGERLAYINRLKNTNIWLKDIVQMIDDFDKNALIVIVADHGGFVGMDYTLQAISKQISLVEAKSVFSSQLSIKWPKNMANNSLDFLTNVNLFKKIFYSLSDNKALLENLSSNASFLPLKEGGTSNYYKYINNNGDFVFDKVLQKD